MQSDDMNMNNNNNNMNNTNNNMNNSNNNNMNNIMNNNMSNSSNDISNKPPFVTAAALSQLLDMLLRPGAGRAPLFAEACHLIAHSGADLA